MQVLAQEGGHDEEGSAKGLRQTVAKLKAELVKMAETEAHFTRVRGRERPFLTFQIQICDFLHLK